MIKTLKELQEYKAMLEQKIPENLKNIEAMKLEYERALVAIQYHPDNQAQEPQRIPISKENVP